MIRLDQECACEVPAVVTIYVRNIPVDICQNCLCFVPRLRAGEHPSSSESKGARPSSLARLLGTSADLVVALSVLSLLAYRVTW